MLTPISPRIERRLLAGLAALPPAVGIGTFLAGLITLRIGFSSPLPAAASFAVAVAIIAALVTGFCAAPSVFWMAQRGPLPLGRLLVLGAVFGNVPLAVIMVVIAIKHRDTAIFLSEIRAISNGTVGVIVRVAMGVGYGMASALLFWLISIRGTEMQVKQRGR